MTNTMTFQVSGMSCGNCKKHVESAALEIHGVKEAQVDLEAGTLRVSLLDAVDVQNIINAIDEAGYRAVLVP